MNLDNIESLASIDSMDMLGSLSRFPEQIDQSYALVSESDIPRFYDVDHVIICGVGEDALAGYLLAGFLYEKITLPIIVHTTGPLPKWVNKHTLVYSISSTGNHTETISSFKQAIQKHCKIIGISSNGTLKDYCLHRNLPFVEVYESIPSRLALGFLFFTILFSLQKTGLLNLGLDSDIDETRFILHQMQKQLPPNVSFNENPAKQLAMKIKDSIPLIFGWDLFSIVAKRWTMQCNLNAKLISYYYSVPECMYYSLVGWANQQQSQQYTSIIFRDHQLESKEMKKRLQFLERFCEEVHTQKICVQPTGKSILSKIFSLVYLGDYMSVYAALNADIDPSPTPILQQLDEELNSF